MRELIPYFRVFFMPLSVGLSLQYSIMNYWLTPFLAIVILPILEIAVKQDYANHSADEMESLEARWSFRLIPVIWTLLQFTLLIWSLISFSHNELSAFQTIGLVLSVGFMTGAIGITVAHELVHKQSRLERFFGDALLASVLYMHFHIEHVAGHHARVATPNDPATARFNESLYRFLIRVIPSSFVSAWQIETRRCQNNSYSAWGIRNRVLTWMFVQLLCVVAVYAAFGIKGILFFFAQALVAITLLETVNYIEHYGLIRSQKANGEYEKVSERHSWEATARITNCILFKLQRHSDHHLNPLRRYQALQFTPESPRMPTGYAGMLVIAFAPPLFRRLVHPRLERYQLERVVRD